MILGTKSFLRIEIRGGRYALMLFVILILLAGCMPRGAVTNPGWTVVAASGKVVYAVLTTGRVIALDAEDGGKELWSYPRIEEKKGGFLAGCSPTTSSSTEKALDAVYGIPALTENLVVVASYDHNLYAFDRSDGSKVGDAFAADGAIIGGVAIRDGIAYFGSSDYKVYAIDIATRKLVWEKPYATDGWVWGTPAVDEKRVYVGSMDHYVYAINRQTGELDWKAPPKEYVPKGAIPGSVTLADGVLLVGGVDKHLHALRAEDGEPFWPEPVSLGHWVWGEALVHDGYVYIGSLDGKVYALKLADGKVKDGWPVEVREKKDGRSVKKEAIRAGPALLDGETLIVGTEIVGTEIVGKAGNVYKINIKTKEKAVLFEAEGAVLSTPAVVGNKVYVGTTAGNIYVWDASSNSAKRLYPSEQKK